MANQVKSYFKRPSKKRIITTYNGERKKPIEIKSIPHLIEEVGKIENKWSTNRNFFDDKYLLIKFEPATKTFSYKNRPAKVYIDHGKVINLHLSNDLSMNKTISQHFFDIINNLRKTSIYQAFSFSLSHIVYNDKGKPELKTKLLRPIDIIRANKLLTYIKNSGADYKVGKSYQFKENTPEIVVEIPRMNKTGYHCIKINNMPTRKKQGYLDFFSINLEVESGSATNKRGLYELRDSFYPQQILAINLALQKLKETYQKIPYLERLFSIPKVSQKLVNLYDIFKNHTLIKDINTHKEVKLDALVDFDYFLMQIIADHASRNDLSIIESIDSNTNIVKPKDLIYELFFYDNKRKIYGFYDCINLGDYMNTEKAIHLRP